MGDVFIRMWASSIERDLARLAKEADQLNEMVSRDKPALDPELIEAAKQIEAARAVFLKYAAKGK